MHPRASFNWHQGAIDAAAHAAHLGRGQQRRRQRLQQRVRGRQHLEQGARGLAEYILVHEQPGRGHHVRHVAALDARIAHLAARARDGRQYARCAAARSGGIGPVFPLLAETSCMASQTQVGVEPACCQRLTQQLVEAAPAATPRRPRMCAAPGAQRRPPRASPLRTASRCLPQSAALVAAGAWRPCAPPRGTCTPAPGSDPGPGTERKAACKGKGSA